MIKAKMVADENIEKFNQSLDEWLETFREMEAKNIQLLPSNCAGQYSDGGFAVMYATLIMGEVEENKESKSE